MEELFLFSRQVQTLLDKVEQEEMQQSAEEFAETLLKQDF